MISMLRYDRPISTLGSGRLLGNICKVTWRCVNRIETSRLRFFFFFDDGRAFSSWRAGFLFWTKSEQSIQSKHDRENQTEIKRIKAPRVKPKNFRKWIYCQLQRERKVLRKAWKFHDYYKKTKKLGWKLNQHLRPLKPLPNPETFHPTQVLPFSWVNSRRLWSSLSIVNSAANLRVDVGTFVSKLYVEVEDFWRCQTRGLEETRCLWK